MTGGNFMFTLSMAMLAVNHEAAYKIAALSIVGITTGAYMAGHEVGKIIQSTGNRIYSFFGNIEKNTKKFTDGIVKNQKALHNAIETTEQAIKRLANTIDESVVILRDEHKKTLVEFRGMGRDVAEAIAQGIKEGKFKPEAKVDANIYAHLGINFNLLRSLF